jgi:type II secretory pathway component GspD/PulD (secretin)
MHIVRQGHHVLLRPGLLSVAMAALLHVSATASPQDLNLPPQLDLQRLVDLTADQLNIDLNYDPAELRGTVVIRSDQDYSSQNLWILTNRVLASHGFTTVRTPNDPTMQVVRIGEASANAVVEGLDSVPLEDPFPGFASIAVEARHRSRDELVNAVKPLLSVGSAGAAGNVTTLGESGPIVLSGLRPHVQQAMRLIATLDVPGESVALVELPVASQSAERVVEAVKALASKQAEVSGQLFRGDVVALPGDDSLLIVAPARELDHWRGLVARMDRPEAVRTETYRPEHYGVGEVASLIEQLVAAEPGGLSLGQGAEHPGDQPFRMVRDTLTHALIITTTESRHIQVKALLDRLEEVPADARRVMRTFPIRNRGVQEVVTLLQQMVDAGIVAGGTTEPSLRPTEGTSFGPGSTFASSPGTQTSDSVRPFAGNGVSDGVPRALILTADEGTNKIIAIGEPRLIEQLGPLIAELDVRQPQVMLEAMIVSLTEGESFDLGVELERIWISGGTIIRLASLFGLSGATGAGETLAREVGDGSGFTGTVISPGDFSVVIRALENVTDGRSMSRPKLLVSNNQQATFDAVLQEPFASVNASNTVSTTSFGGTQNAGTQISIRPQIAEGDHVVLEYSVTLSSFTGESADPALPPPRQQNNVQSVVTIPDGHTVVVNGLEVVTDGDAETRVPLIGSIPIIGEAFKNRSRSASRTRFYVFIRADVMRDRGFEDLRYISAQDLDDAGVDDAWPVVEPRIIR